MHARGEELDKLVLEHTHELQEVASMTREQARAALIKELNEELTHEYGSMIRRSQEQGKLQAEEHARKVITLAIERYSCRTRG